MAGLSREHAKIIAEATGLAIGLIMVMAGHFAPSIEEARRYIDAGQEIGGSLVERIREEARLARYAS